MLPFFDSDYGNAHSTSHLFGESARQAVTQARERIASAINASPEELVFTSGATESNNLAIRGVAHHPRNQRRRVAAISTEHHAVLDPLHRLGQADFDVDLIPVHSDEDSLAGVAMMARIEEALGEETCLVSAMLANNEIGVLQPLSEIAEIASPRGVLVHCDATQAVGKIHVDVESLGVDLMSFTAHKLHGPKGVGCLYVRRRRPKIRLLPQLDGGGQESGLRSGTLNVAGIVGLATAIELSVNALDQEAEQMAKLRDRLFYGLKEALPSTQLNGPPLEDRSLRLPGNLSCRFPGLDGEALLMRVPHIAASTGAACTSVRPEPSHVLKALGLSDDDIRSSLRFGLSRFTTSEEIETVIPQLASAIRELQALS